jgi:hypothetical protein
MKWLVDRLITPKAEVISLRKGVDAVRSARCVSYWPEKPPTPL